MSSINFSSKLRGIHDRINRVSHWDVNVTDLERSRAWYEATTPLRVVAQTVAEQDFPELGITGGVFKGYLMRDQNSPTSHPAIHLVQWQSPQPVGKPYLSHTNVGWYRIVPVVHDTNAALQSCVDQGSRPFAPITNTTLHLNPEWPSMDYQVFTTHDPDKIAVEFSLANNHTGTAATMAPYTVAHNTSNLEKNIGFYLDVLGLDIQGSVQTRHQVRDVYSPVGEPTGLTGAFSTVRNDSSYVLDWLQWIQSPQNSIPYIEPNHVGIIRCVLEVDDMDAAYKSLKASLDTSGCKFFLSEPNIWDFGPDFGAHNVLNFEDPEGVGFQLIEQRKVALKLHPWGKHAEFQE